MRTILAGLLVLLAACETIDSQSDRSMFSDVTPGSTLVLHEILPVPSDERSIYISRGRLMEDPDDYDLSCFFRLRDESVRFVQTGHFTVTASDSDTEDIGEGFIDRRLRVYELQSDAQPGVLRMICSKWDSAIIPNPITLAEIKKTLGAVVTFEAPKPERRVNP